MKIYSYGLTDCGLTRSINEDRLYIEPDFGLYVICDGMNGSVSDTNVSSVVIEEVVKLIHQCGSDVEDLHSAAASRALGEIICDVNEKINKILGGGELVGSRTSTLVLLFIKNDQGLIIHLGNSRCYRLRDKELDLFTKDHTRVQMMVDQGVITNEDAKCHPMRSQLIQVVGQPGRIVPDLLNMELVRRDRFLLCSDGLNGMLSDAEIEEILVSQTNPKEACEVLVSCANKAGGQDNITVIVVDIT